MNYKVTEHMDNKESFNVYGQSCSIPTARLPKTNHGNHSNPRLRETVLMMF
jgi:hypothetical protein